MLAMQAPMNCFVSSTEFGLQTSNRENSGMAAYLWTCAQSSDT